MSWTSLNVLSIFRQQKSRNLVRIQWNFRQPRSQKVGNVALALELKIYLLRLLGIWCRPETIQWSAIANYRINEEELLRMSKFGRHEFVSAIFWPALTCQAYHEDHTWQVRLIREFWLKVNCNKISWKLKYIVVNFCIFTIF